MWYLAYTMSKTYPKCSNVFVIAVLSIFIHFCTSAPVNVTENAYTQFVAELNRNKCSLPSQIQLHLPFDMTKVNNFEYLSSFLEICQKTESRKHNKEAVVICNEIFDNIRNISCPTKTVVSDISVKLSENVCQDINALEDSVPEDNKSFLKRLTDSLLCDIMCDSEFEKACQVLLWSFKVRKQIANVASTQEPELPNMSESGGDKNVDSKQDGTVHRNGLPKISVDSENEGKNAEEAKNVQEFGLDGIAEVPNPSKLETNPEQKLDISPISKDIGKQENIAVLKVISQDSTGASKFISTEIGSTVTQQKSNAQALNSNTEVKPVAEMTKSESDEQNAYKQLQSNITEFGQVNAGGELPQGFNTNVITVEQTQDVNTNTLPDRGVQDKKDTYILVNEHPQDSYNAANQNTPVDGEGNISGHKILNETLAKDINFSYNNYLPNESANERIPINADDDLHNDQNPSNLVNTIDQNKHQRTSNNDNDLAKKTNSPSTNSQVIKDAIEQQTVQESIQDKTNISRDETKVDQPQINSTLKNPSEMDVITHDLTTNNKTKNTSTYQKKPEIAQQTEDLGNTIPEAAGTSVNSDKKLPENLKPTVVNLDKSFTLSSLMEASTQIAVSLEKVEGDSDINQPADDEADQFEDPENIEGEEYLGPDRGDGGFENKASSPNVPSFVTASKEIITSQNEKPMEFPSRNAFGQDSSDFRVISPFPEQEDGHFFFYFLSIVLLLMAGYLIFHNKQKIIALIVEGRHERNRRSHRIGYKKLETK